MVAKSYTIDKAKSNRSHCKHCNCKIEKDSLKVVETEFGYFTTSKSLCCDCAIKTIGVEIVDLRNKQEILKNGK